MRLLSNYPNNHEIDQLFNAAFGHFNRSRLNQSLNRPPVAMDLFQSENAYHARMELPGFEREQIEITLEDGTLTLKANTETTEEAKNTVRSISHQLRVPDDVDMDQIKAQYEAGILTLDLYKSEKAKPKQIAIS